MSLRSQLLTKVRRDIGSLMKDYPTMAPTATRVQQELDDWVALLTRHAVPSQADQARHFACVDHELLQLGILHKEIDEVAAERIATIYALFARAKP